MMTMRFASPREDDPMTRLLLLILALLTSLAAFADDTDWQLVFADDGKGDWAKNWFLEGDKASVTNTPDGMVFTAGPVPREHASHAVLWTKASYVGDIRIEYDYTRLDDAYDLGVNILYIQATGLGTEEHPKDIYLSTRSRAEPWMKYYFLYMHSLHISYATDRDYVSARRYPAPALGQFNQETKIQPVNNDVGMFEAGNTYHITATKRGQQLTFRVQGNGHDRTFAWDGSAFPPITEGRIGLRHMWTRSSRYENFKIYTAPQQ